MQGALEPPIQFVPNLSGVGVLWDPSTGSLQLKAVEEAARGFNISAQVFEARRAADIAEAFYALDRLRIQGLLLLSSPLFAGNLHLLRRSRSEEIFRRSPCSPRLQEQAGCSVMGRTSNIFFVRLERWRARSC